MAERKRIGVPISGLDTSTPDHSVVDGKCETLHNLRYTGEAWRNVNELPCQLYVKEDSEGVEKEYNYKSWCRIIGSRFDYDGKPIDTKLEIIPLFSLVEPIANATATKSGSDIFSMKSNMKVELVGKNQFIGYRRDLYDFTYTLDDFVGQQFEDRDREVYSVIKSDSDNLFASMYEYKNMGAYSETHPTLFCEESLYSIKVGSSLYYPSPWHGNFNGQSEECDEILWSMGKVTEVVAVDRTNRTVKLKVFTRNNIEEEMLIGYESNVVSTVSKYRLHAYKAPGETSPSNIFYTAEGGNYFYAINPNIYAYGHELMLMAKIVKQEKFTESVINVAGYDYSGLKRYPEGDLHIYDISTNYTIVYKHQIDKEGYVVKQKKNVENGDGTTKSIYTYTRAVFSTSGIMEDSSSDICEIEETHEYSISHFGKVLIISDLSIKKNRYFIFADNVYKEFSSSDIKCSTSTEIERICATPSATYQSGLTGEPNIAVIQDTILDETNPVWSQGSELDNAWRGEIGIFCALRSEDGSILKTMPIQIINTAEDENGKLRIEEDAYLYPALDMADVSYSGIRIIGNKTHLYSRVDRTYNGSTAWIPSNEFEALVISAEKYTSNQKTALKRILPYHVMCNAKYTIKLEHPNMPDIIDNVAIYCTRIHNPFVSVPTSTTVTGKSIPTETYVNPDNLFNDTYYLLDIISVKEFEIVGRTMQYTENIDYAKLRNIIHTGTVYEPVQSIENFFFEESKEFNNRLHICGLTLIPSLPHEHTFNYTSDTDNIGDKCVILFQREEDTHRQSFTSYEVSGNEELYFANKQKAYMSIPYRNATFNFGIKNLNDDTTIDVLNRVSTSYSTLLGVSYAIGDARATRKDANNYTYNSLRKYEAIEGNNDTKLTLPFNNTEIKETNRLQVSELNNPFALPNGLSYRLGLSSNEIFAIDSVAIEMSDAKFGEFPLFVFTKEGIYAMQSGKNTLYSDIQPTINYDAIINPNTLAVNGAVLYFTNKGLCAIADKNTKSTVLSNAINDFNNQPPIGYIETANIYHHTPYNEVIVHNPMFDYAYVFSIDSGHWSTRNFKGNMIDRDTVYTSSQIGNIATHEIFNLKRAEIANKPYSFSLSTRPIKLGSMELKRAETIIVRFECATEQTLNVKVEGSIDTQNWKTLRKLEGVQTNKDILIRRTPCSVKYLRFTIDGNVTDDIRILAFELEYYERMRHRMR